MAVDAVAEAKKSVARIAERDKDVRAWEHVDGEGALAQAARSDPMLPLYAFTFGIKDLIDVEGMPTTWGTPIYAGNIAAHDAACVALARAAGAVILGKTVTTEFAYVAPSKTRNPWNFGHTPGGSSSGSAAAVADGHVRAAFGSQTMGSVLRPAAFCGVVGYKPTYATISLEGAHAVAPSFDTLGWMTRGVADAAAIRSALLGLAPPRLEGPVPRIGLLRSSAWPKAQKAMQEMVEGVARDIEAPEVDFGFDDYDDVFFPIANFEMRQSLAAERLQHFDRLREQTRKLLETEYGFEQAQHARKRLRSFDADAAFGTADVLIMPSSPGEAPDPSQTGDPVFNRLASLLGLPAITIPLKLGPAGLPMGLQLIARCHEDEALLVAANALAERYPFRERPKT
jgi:Asp-tRNA(Asn)/Glu-tRNA(Gln) amidotransferase A subunit family amidase